MEGNFSHDCGGQAIGEVGHPLGVARRTQFLLQQEKARIISCDSAGFPSGYGRIHGAGRCILPEFPKDCNEDGGIIFATYQVNRNISDSRSGVTLLELQDDFREELRLKKGFVMPILWISLTDFRIAELLGRLYTFLAMEYLIGCTLGVMLKV